MTYAEVLARYDRYVDSFRTETGDLPKMMQLKRVHTDAVVENARRIATDEHLDASLTERAAIAALLHDTGRYEQLKRYNTFRDSESCDHAVLSHDIVHAASWVDDEPILKAVLYHNRRDLPEDMDADTAVLSKIVRDADKLDIFRVLEDQIASTDWRTDKRAFWNLATEEEPNPAVIDAIREGRAVDYQQIKSLSDFVLIQVGWIRSGLYFAASRQLAHSRGHLAFRYRFLKELTASTEIDRLFVDCQLERNMVE